MHAKDPADRRSIVPALMAAGAVVITVSLAAVLQWQTRRHVFDAGFWFEDLAFDRPMRATRLGGTITADEVETIKSVAWAELRTAYSGLRIAFSDDRRAHYRVRVVEQFAPKAGPPGPAGESRPMGVLGGEGAVSFHTVARLAIHYAPADAARAAIIEAIGRGVGRAAAHEFAHQILSPIDLHTSKDVRSYEYSTADRVEQYYGSLRWDTAWPVLVRKLGR